MRSFLRRTRESLAVGALLVAACSGGEDSSGTARPLGPAPTGQYAVRLEVRSDTLPYGESRQYAAQVSDAKGTPMAASVTWTSTDPAVVTVDGGVATAVGFGVAGIVARYGAAADTATLVVSSAGVALQLFPSAVAASLGDTLEFDARFVTSSGSSAAARSVRWAVSDSSAAQVLGDGSVATMKAGDVNVIATVSGKMATAPVRISPPNAHSVTIDPTAASIEVGGSLTLHATVLDQKGHVLRTVPDSWTSSDASVATVDNSGAVKGVSRGGVMVTATSGSKSATAVVNVVSPPAASLTLTLDPDTIAVGSQVQAVAVPRDANGQPVSGRLIAYQSSNPAVATITNTGLITAYAVGATNMSAICDGLITTVKLTVQIQRVVSVTIVPHAPVVVKGTTATLIASVLDQTGQAMPGAAVAWSSQTPSVATISPSGVLTGIAVGSSQVSATAGGLTATAIATVSTQPVASVQVAPSTLSVQTGQSAALSATAFNGSGQAISGAAFSWSSSNSAVASVSALGVVSASAAGNATITASSDGQSGSAAVAVSVPPPASVASIGVVLGSSALTVGQLTQAVATLYDAQGNVLSGRSVTWSSADASVAKVSSSGVVTAVGAGTVSIIASSDGQTGFASITIAAAPPAPVASVAVTAPGTVLDIGQTSQLTVTLRDAAGNVLTGRTISYASSNTTVATVSPSALVTARAGGTATITVSSEGVSGTIAFTVSPAAPTLLQVVLTPATVTLNPGATQQFAVSGSWSDGSTSAPPVTYSATGGTIIAGGLYTAGATAGTFRVIATQQSGTKADTSTVIISAPVVTLLQLVLSPASITLAPGGTSQFSVSGTWSDGSSTAPALTYSATGGTITIAGLYTAGTTEGSYRVIATLQGGTKADTSEVKVAVPTLRSLAEARGFLVGASTRMYPLNTDSMYRRILSTQYSVITPEGELKFGRLSPSRGVYVWTDADAVLAFADAHGMTVHGHTLVWDQAQPEWLTTGTFTRAELLTILHDHITTVVSRYRGRIHTWDVVNEALDINGAWVQSQWYTVIGPAYVDSAFAWARRADPAAQLYYNDWGGEGATPKADSIFKLVSQLRSRGIPVDGVGMQMHFGTNYMPDASSVVQNMTRLAMLGLDIRISEFDFRIEDAQAATSAALARQATAYSDMLGACLLVPRCRSFTSWGFTDLHSWVPEYFSGWGSALPFDAQYRPKPAFSAMITRLSGK